MTVSHKNRVQMSVSGTPGTGTITLGSASSGYQTFAAAYAANAAVDVLITDGTAWEVARNCTYTNIGTTLTRGTLEASSTGSAISLTSSAVVSEVMTAAFGNELETARQTYITGLLVTKNSGGNTLDISAGACYDPSSGKVISYAGATGVSAGTLGVSQWNQVYIYDSSGTATIEVVNNAAPPSTAYAGTARQGGTNSNRRWIGSFLTTSGSNVKAVTCYESGMNSVRVINKVTNSFDAPHRVVNAGTSTTFASETTLVGCIPRYVATQMFATITVGYSGTAGSDCILSLSLDGTNAIAALRAYVYSNTNGFPGNVLWLPISQSTPGIWYKLIVVSPGASPLCYIDVPGYEFVR